jgi:hypothetical protein
VLTDNEDRDPRFELQSPVSSPAPEEAGPSNLRSVSPLPTPLSSSSPLPAPSSQQGKTLAEVDDDSSLVSKAHSRLGLMNLAKPIIPASNDTSNQVRHIADNPDASNVDDRGDDDVAINGDINGDVNGDDDGDINGDINGDVDGDINGDDDVDVDINGDINGDDDGDVAINGDINGDGDGAGDVDINADDDETVSLNSTSSHDADDIVNSDRQREHSHGFETQQQPPQPFGGAISLQIGLCKRNFIHFVCLLFFQ